MFFINQLCGNVLLTLGHPDLRQVCATSTHSGAGLLHLHCKKLECLCSKATRKGWKHEGEDRNSLKVSGPSSCQKHFPSLSSFPGVCWSPRDQAWPVSPRPLLCRWLTIQLVSASHFVFCKGHILGNFSPNIRNLQQKPQNESVTGLIDPLSSWTSTFRSTRQKAVESNLLAVIGAAVRLPWCKAGAWFSAPWLRGDYSHEHSRPLQALV